MFYAIFFYYYWTTNSFSRYHSNYKGKRINLSNDFIMLFCKSSILKVLVKFVLSIGFRFICCICVQARIQYVNMMLKCHAIINRIMYLIDKNTHNSLMILRVARCNHLLVYKGEKCSGDLTLRITATYSNVFNVSSFVFPSFFFLTEINANK